MCFQGRHYSKEGRHGERARTRTADAQATCVNGLEANVLMRKMGTDSWTSSLRFPSVMG